ncbi:MAG: MFS transporter [Anaeromyxobacteraceae bacterium]
MSSASPRPAGTHPARRFTSVRGSLAASTAEGVVAELFSACAGPTVLTAWALHLGASAFVVALVTALPQFATCAQLPAAWLSARFGRRRVALVTLGLSRQAVLPLLLVPGLGLGPEAARALLVAVAGSSAVLGVAGGNAWTAWMGELVPARLRGRYFGLRTAALTGCATAAGLAVGLALDGAASRGRSELALSLLTLAASAFGAATVLLLARQRDPGGAGPGETTLGAALRPLSDPDARGLLVYQVAWNGAVGLSAACFTWHLVKNVGAGFTVVALHGAGAASARVLAAPLWGRAIDRLGARPVLLTCSVALGLLPLGWLLVGPDRLWPLFIDAPLGGIAWSGHGLAAFAAPLAVSPRRGRPYYLAAFSMAGGLAWGAATAASGAVLAALPVAATSLGRGPAHAVDLAFVTSCGCRLAAATLAGDIAERGARPVRELLFS